MANTTRLSLIFAHDPLQSLGQRFFAWPRVDTHGDAYVHMSQDGRHVAHTTPRLIGAKGARSAQKMKSWTTSGRPSW